NNVTTLSDSVPLALRVVGIALVNRSQEGLSLGDGSVDVFVEWTFVGVGVPRARVRIRSDPSSPQMGAARGAAHAKLRAQLSDPHRYDEPSRTSRPCHLPHEVAIRRGVSSARGISPQEFRAAEDRGETGELPLDGRRVARSLSLTRAQLELPNFGQPH